MFFESVEEIIPIAKKTGTSIFVVPRGETVEIKGAIILQPEEKTVITIEQVRDAMYALTTKQTKDVFVLIRPAEKMNDESANALLKSLEEPQDKVHFVLVTDQPSKILPTILSKSPLVLNQHFSWCLVF